MERERILRALEDAYFEIADPDEETFAEFLKSWDLDPGFPVAWVAETVIEAVETLAARKFGWYWEPLRDDYNFSGEFAFVLVDPQTHRCLTFSESPTGGHSVAVVLRITSIDEAVEAVQYLLSLIGN